MIPFLVAGLWTALAGVNLLLAPGGPESMYSVLGLAGLWGLGLAIIGLGSRQLRLARARLASSREESGARISRLEQELAAGADGRLAAQRQLQSFLNNIEAGAFLKNERHEYTLVNPRLCAILGVSSKDLLGSTGYSRLPRSAAWRMVELEQQAIREGRTAELYDLFETTGLDRSRIYSLHIFPVFTPQGGGIEGTGGLLVDVTERRRLGQAIVEAQEAEKKANLAKNAFLANISHEIRTPLNGIIGTADLLARAKLTEDQLAIISTIKRSGCALLTVLNDILDISEIEAGKMTLTPQPFNLPDLIFDAVAEQAALAGNPALEVLVDLAPGVPGRVLGDPARLRQILGNLVSNAFKFTSQGEISLTAENLDDAPPAGGPGSPGGEARLRFIVADTGIGIPWDKREIIFQSFEQADTSNVRTFGGTGLGLTICHRLLYLMNSRLNLQSQVDQGSSFWFDLVLPALAEDGEPSPRGGPAPLAGRSLLLVDDHDRHRRLLAAELKKLGLKLEEAGGANEASRLFRQAADQGRPFDLVVTDYLMPGPSGLDLLRELRSCPSGRQLPVILLSAVESAEIPPGQPSFAAVLPKPVRPAALARALEEALKPGAGEAEGTEAAAPAPDKPAAAPPGRGLRVLLVEDLEMNQVVGARLLQELGHQAVVAGDGGQALALLGQRGGGGDFDLVLMDIQMPVMDGLETTARLRRLEAENGWPPLPIVALTAHSAKGDRDKYLGLGLDDYLTKPIMLDELAGLIDRLAGRRSPPPPEPAAETAESSPLEEDLMKRSFGANEKLLKKSLEIYLRDAPVLVRNIHEALEADDPQKTASLAHALKGISSYYTHGGPFELARRLDQAARGGPWPEVKPELESLAADLNRSVASLMSAMSARLAGSA